MKLKDLPIFLLLMFTVVYSVAGNPADEIWSGAYFFVNYLTMFMLFKRENNKVNRIIGMSLSVSILIFIALKYFLHLNINREYTTVPLIISIIALYKLECRN